MLLVALVAAFAMQAQDQPRHHGRHGHHMNPEKAIEMRVDRLDKALGLTPEQKTAITAIFTRQAEEMKAKREQMSQNGERPSREQVRAKAQQLDAEVEAVLTAEQKAKYATLKQQHEQRGHKGGHDRKGAPKGKDGCKDDCCKQGDKQCCDKKQGCEKAEPQKVN